MFGVSINTKKAHEIPTSLTSWTAAAHKGPRALVAGLNGVGAAETDEFAATYTLKGWTAELGPRALVAQMSN